MGVCVFFLFFFFGGGAKIKDIFGGMPDIPDIFYFIFFWGGGG